ncbi:winged helix-turn-helix domain-containing protein [Yersinia intermedia]|uniref:winged helix-turn-helix domain-containing protein n=1 Tax=Yersinia intermedia TaxID=631 RepID=UPI001643C536|nr:winged helix-turn-helix domain-containing protein [Yersinia intermedia]
MKILFIDGAQKSLHYNNKKIMLTEKEFLMLELLLSKRKNNNIPIDEIITHVWSGRENTILKGNVSQLTYRLRSKLSAIGDAIQISISMNSGGRCKVHRDAITIITTNNGILCLLLKSLLNINKNDAI